MLDINFIRENLDKVKKSVEGRSAEVDLDKLIQLDDQRRKLIIQVDELRAKRNQAAQAKDIETGKKIKGELDGLEKELDGVEKEWQDLMLQVPNLIADDVPEGKDESENKVLRKWGEPTNLDFKVKDHVELGELLGGIEIEKAAKVAGARFNYLMGETALLELALVRYSLEILTNQKIVESIANEVGVSSKPFIPVIPPAMVKPEVFTKMARLSPKVAEERYYLPKDDLYLIGSAEHTLGPLHMDETIPEGDLPVRYVGFSPAYRREAGSYGKDTRGILRVHQFDKVEMESFSLPEDGLKEQEFFVAIQEYLMQSLGLPYQEVMICSGDMGDPDYRQIDIETWLPSQEKYRETHTSDYMTDYQSRRLNTKFRRKEETGFVHMNDATAFAIGRIIIAILENFQQEDGSVKIPEVLQKYTGFSEIKPKK